MSISLDRSKRASLVTFQVNAATVTDHAVVRVDPLALVTYPELSLVVNTTSADSGVSVLRACLTNVLRGQVRARLHVIWMSLTATCR